MPLTMAKPGETVVIRKITGKDEVRQHLADLGQSDPSGEGQPDRPGQNHGKPGDDLRRNEA